MTASPDDAAIALLKERSAVETSSKVKKEIAVALALVELNDSDAQVRLNAIHTLTISTSQDVRNKLAGLLEQTDGKFAESDEHVRKAAAAAMLTIDRWRMFYSGIETLFFGLSLGSVLVLIAIGLAITFGVMGVINMAWRTDDAGRLHHLRGTDGNAWTYRHFPLSWRSRPRSSYRL
jgi:urea transport system permease protein